MTRTGSFADRTLPWFSLGVVGDRLVPPARVEAALCWACARVRWTHQVALVVTGPRAWAWPLSGPEPSVHLVPVGRGHLRVALPAWEAELVGAASGLLVFDDGRYRRLRRRAEAAGVPVRVWRVD